MPMEMIAINVGNTRVQLALFADGQPVEKHRCGREDDAALGAALQGLRRKAATAYLATVHEASGQRIAEMARKLLGCPVSRVERDVPIAIGRGVDREAVVGDDRLLNAAAAFDRYKQACIVVDAGTAVTVDFIDGEGVFHGGAILPGLRMQGAALHEKTAQLPLVDPESPRKPPGPIGHNTAEAIRTGLFHGLRGAVRELVERYAEFYQAYPKVIATGGDAAFLFEGYDLIEAIHPELTLEGMAVTHRHAMEQGDRDDG